MKAIEDGERTHSHFGSAWQRQLQHHSPVCTVNNREAELDLPEEIALVQAPVVGKETRQLLAEDALETEVEERKD